MISLLVEDKGHRLDLSLNLRYYCCCRDSCEDDNSGVGDERESNKLITIAIRRVQHANADNASCAKPKKKNEN